MKLVLLDETDAPEGWATLPLSSIRSRRTKLFNPTLAGSAEYELYSIPSHASGEPEILAAKDIGSNKQYVSEGSVLISKINPRLNRTWIVRKPQGFAQIASTEWIVFEQTHAISPRLLAYMLRDGRVRDYLSHHASGVGGSLTRVRPDILDTVYVGLPPLREQHRILAKIEELFSELDKAVESLTLARSRLKAYRQALLKAAFEGRLTANWRGSKSQDWQSTRLGAETAFLTSGSRGWGDYYADQGDIFIRAQNLKHDRLDLKEIAFVQLPKSATEGLRTRVQVGDVLITITGANVTKTGIVHRDLGTAFVSQHVALCRPRGTLRPEFLYWYLLSETGGRRQLNAAAYGAGKPGLNLENIRQIKIELPPVDEQDEIVTHLNALLSEQEHLDRSIEDELRRTAALRQSILQKAFSGRLVTQDPADEPATILLARLRSQATAPRTRRRKTA